MARPYLQPVQMVGFSHKTVMIFLANPVKVCLVPQQDAVSGSYLIGKMQRKMFTRALVQLVVVKKQQRTIIALHDGPALLLSLYSAV